MLGSASLVHPGLSAGGLTDLSGLESLVSNSTGGDPLGGHHPHHSLHHSSSHQLHQLHSGQHHPHHHHQLSHSLHHPPNQPLPPHRPFTPPGVLGSLTSHATSSSSVLNNNNNNNNNSLGSVVDSSYSPNSTSGHHLPSSTVKVKPGTVKPQYLTLFYHTDSIKHYY
jgi:hypothetical protein